MRIAPRNIVSFIITLSFTVLAAALGARSLADPDLGWHLSGGLWMLERGQIPRTDPFGSEGAFWLCYSWLFELILGVIFQLGNFRALQYLQNALAILSVWILLHLVRSALQSKEKLLPVASLLVQVLSLLVAICFINPVWSLRPQLVSLIFLAYLLSLVEGVRLTPWRVVPLTLIWVNIHVYWVFVPLVTLLFQGIVVRGKSVYFSTRGCFYALGYFVLGLVNPYGWAHFQGLFRYAFVHQGADSFILELRRLTPDVGLLFWLVLGLVSLLLLFWRSIKSQCRPQSIILAGIFLGAAILRIKFIPSFAISCLPLLAQGVFVPVVAYVGRWQKTLTSQEIQGEKVSQLGLLGHIPLVLFGVALISYFLQATPPLEKWQTELLDIGRQVTASAPHTSSEAVNVLSYFDHGGWLILAFHLARERGAAVSRYKVAVDGRSLVLGERRLQEFQRIRALEPGWQDTIQGWKIRLLVSPAPDRLIAELAQEQSERESWVALYKTESFVVLSRDN